MINNIMKYTNMYVISFFSVGLLVSFLVGVL